MGSKAVVSLTTGLEDPERVTVAFLVCPICVTAKGLDDAPLIDGARLGGTEHVESCGAQPLRPQQRLGRTGRESPLRSVGSAAGADAEWLSRHIPREMPTLRQMRR